MFAGCLVVVVFWVFGDLYCAASCLQGGVWWLF